MDPTLVLILVAVVILAMGIVIWITSRRRRESALESMRSRTLATSAPARTPNTIAQVRALMAEGKKIDAIKVLREATGMGLAEAKAAVEKLEVDGGRQDRHSPTAPPPAQLPAELAATVRGMLQRGDKIAAIKLVRERMKLDLKDSKELVDKIE